MTNVERGRNPHDPLPLGVKMRIGSGAMCDVGVTFDVGPKGTYGVSAAELAAVLNGLPPEDLARTHLWFQGTTVVEECAHDTPPPRLAALDSPAPQSATARTGTGMLSFAGGRLIMNPEDRTILVDDAELPTKPDHYKILHLLGIHAPEPVSRDEIRRTAWGDEERGPQALNVAILHIRDGLRPYGLHGIIRTVYGCGYALDGMQIQPAP